MYAIRSYYGNSIYDNAGKTQKSGFEFIGNYLITTELSIGVSYTYSDFKYKTFEEKVGRDFVSRNGNYLPYIPKNQYALNASYTMANGFKSRIQARSYGSYYMDNANSQKYQGYDLVTDLMVGYDYHNHSIQLNAYNIFDKHYAAEATKDVYGNETYRITSYNVCYTKLLRDMISAVADRYLKHIHFNYLSILLLIMSRNNFV